MNSILLKLCILGGAAIIVTLIVIVVFIIISHINPFTYPVIKYSIDISGRKQPSYKDCVDQWVIDNKDYNAVNHYNHVISKWDNDCRRILEKTHLGKERKTQIYNNMKNAVNSSEYPIYQYVFFRRQVRYKQSNYKKQAYSVNNTEGVYKLTLKQLLEIYDELEEIDFETTRQKYYAKNQRKLMTKELRQLIIKRDNYTCQKCGKYMPDEVGLHVDHIIAIKNGGKTVESNLQVLCDKCNYRKGSKKQN
ncbi:HNH endonuclease signature motif containing protein [Ruminococcus sp.]|uniref:HNH endonuclease n=1 Tax=Ruminococcus sp. TaxID=41978 RepID=UPI0025EA75BF|nr:HNH endonuclease signature motif containing protein [Ruminococcus sp.]